MKTAAACASAAEEKHTSQAKAESHTHRTPCEAPLGRWARGNNRLLLFSRAGMIKSTKVLLITRGWGTTGAEREPRGVKVISRVEKIRQVDLGRTPGMSPSPILEQNLLPDTDAPGLKMLFKL